MRAKKEKVCPKNKGRHLLEGTGGLCCLVDHALTYACAMIFILFFFWFCCAAIEISGGASTAAMEDAQGEIVRCIFYCGVVAAYMETLRSKIVYVSGKVAEAYLTISPTHLHPAWSESNAS